MNIEPSFTDNGANLTLTVKGAFNFYIAENFKKMYTELTPDLEKITIDLSETKHLDSSTLCLLLNVHERLRGKVNSICLSNCEPKIKQSLNLAKLEREFEIT